jgi:hypothetical protein
MSLPLYGDAPPGVTATNDVIDWGAVSVKDGGAKIDNSISIVPDNTVPFAIANDPKTTNASSATSSTLGDVTLSDGSNAGAGVSGELSSNDGTNIFGLPYNYSFSDLGKSLGLTGTSGTTADSQWWNTAFSKAWNYISRFGIILIAIVLIGAGAWALAREHGVTGKG